MEQTSLGANGKMYFLQADIMDLVLVEELRSAQHLLILPMGVSQN